MISIESLVFSCSSNLLYDKVWQKRYFSHIVLVLQDSCLDVLGSNDESKIVFRRDKDDEIAFIFDDAIKVVRETSDNEMKVTLENTMKFSAFPFACLFHFLANSMDEELHFSLMEKRQSLAFLSDNLLLEFKLCLLRWQRSVHKRLLEFCLVFAPMRLPPYVLLEIFDWLPFMAQIQHLQKILLIESVSRSCKRVRAEKETRQKSDE